MLDNARDIAIALSTVPGLVASKMHQLIEYCGSLEQFWSSSQEEWVKFGVPAEVAAELAEVRAEFSVSRYLNHLDKLGVNVITYLDDEYPGSLRQLYDPPVVLYLMGSLPPDLPYLAVVGTRKRTRYGQSVVNKLVSDLAAEGIVIVSGLAYGIDGDAHRCALQNKGLTVAVLGSGLDQPTPRRHQQLMAQIVASGGAVISEYPPGFTARKWTFPARNRIIAGLSAGVLVVEAGNKSGALITADFAMELGREVYAVPGSIFSSVSVGTNSLIQQGAKLVMSVADILEDFEINAPQPTQRSISLNSELEAQLLEILSGVPLHIDEITARVKRSVAEVLPVLTLLCLRGLVIEYPGKLFQSINS